MTEHPDDARLSDDPPIPMEDSIALATASPPTADRRRKPRPFSIFLSR
jgi:hypothetical protein